jgi:transposase
MIVDGVVKAPDLIHFLQRLIRDARCKVFLILDRLKVHLARLTRDWLAEHRSEIEVHYLPPYSPELNPDEGVNADLKHAVPRKAPARSKPQLKRVAISHMRSLSRRPQRIRSIFRHPQFRYAA